MEAVALKQPDIRHIISHVPREFSQARRLITYLSNNPNSVTDDVMRECKVSNISDVARRVNNLMFKHSLFISCKRPVIPFNQSNDLSSGFLWGIYKLPKQARNSLEGTPYARA